MAELADAQLSKSCELNARVGSTPTLATKNSLAIGYKQSVVRDIASRKESFQYPTSRF